MADVDGGETDGSSPDDAVAKRVGEQTKRLLRIVVPTSAVVGLLFFFGRVYTRELHRALGIDVDALNLASAEVVSQSVNVVVDALAAVAAVVVLASLVHLAIVRSVSGQDFGDRIDEGSEGRQPDTRSVRLRRIRVGAAALIAIGVGTMILFFVPATTGIAAVVADVLWLFGAVAAVYGGLLVWRFSALGDERRAGRLGRSLTSNQRTNLGIALLMAAVLLLAHGVFELTHTYATERGRSAATWVERHCEEYLVVQVLSEVDLQLAGEGVVARKLPGNGGFVFLYEGFRRFDHRNGYFVIWPMAVSPRARMLMIRDDDRTRLEPARIQEVRKPCPVSQR